MVRTARGLAWSWVTSSTLVNRGGGSKLTWQTWRYPVQESEQDDVPEAAPHCSTDDGARHGATQSNGQPEKPGQSRAALTITHPNAAGIDIGSAAHFVAVPPDRDDAPVRQFPSFTVDLNGLADQ